MKKLWPVTKASKMLVLKSCVVPEGQHSDNTIDGSEILMVTEKHMYLKAWINYHLFSIKNHCAVLVPKIQDVKFNIFEVLATFFTSGGILIDLKKYKAPCICDLASENQPSSHIRFYQVNTP